MKSRDAIVNPGAAQELRRAELRALTRELRRKYTSLIAEAASVADRKRLKAQLKAEIAQLESTFDIEGRDFRQHHV